MAIKVKKFDISEDIKNKMSSNLLTIDDINRAVKIKEKQTKSKTSDAQ